MILKFLTKMERDRASDKSGNLSDAMTHYDAVSPTSYIVDCHRPTSSLHLLTGYNNKQLSDESAPDVRFIARVDVISQRGASPSSILLNKRNKSDIWQRRI